MLLVFSATYCGTECIFLCRFHFKTSIPSYCDAVTSMKNMEQFSVFLRLHSEVNLRNLCHLESKSLTGDLLDVIYVQV